MNAMSGCFQWWWLRLPKALAHSSLFGCFGFHFQVMAFCTLYLVAEPSTLSSFSASLPLPGLWGWWPGLVQGRVVTSAQTICEPSALPELQGLGCKPEQSRICKAQHSISLSSPGCTVFPGSRQISLLSFSTWLSPSLAHGSGWTKSCLL